MLKVSCKSKPRYFIYTYRLIHGFDKLKVNGESIVYINRHKYINTMNKIYNKQWLLFYSKKKKE
jgi:hypothetical protein